MGSGQLSMFFFVTVLSDQGPQPRMISVNVVFFKDPSKDDFIAL